jgi:phospholipase C
MDAPFGTSQSPYVTFTRNSLISRSREVDSSLSNETDYLLPWYLNYLGGNWSEATQCMVAGSNDYFSNHAALNGDLNNHWATNNTPWSWGYFKREDLPVHFAMAEAYTTNDMYQEGQITATNPNRVTWVSGTINAPGTPTNPNNTGGVYIDNNETPGAILLRCY